MQHINRIPRGKQITKDNKKIQTKRQKEAGKNIKETFRRVRPGRVKRRTTT